MEDSTKRKKKNSTGEEEKPSASATVNSPDYCVKKRPPPMLPKGRNDVYINHKSSFIAQFNKCKTLLNKEEEICVHGLGAAVNIAVNLALQLKSFYMDSLVLDATTSSVTLVDDYVPVAGGGRQHSEQRKNSAIHIKIRRVSSA